MGSDGSNLEFYASASPGTEEALRDELAELGFRSTRLNRGGIPFVGPRSEGYRACLESRIAQRIYVVLLRESIANVDDYYAAIHSIDWTQFLSPRHTLAVSAVTHEDYLSHSGFAVLKAKDAIVDRVRESCGERPNIDRESPDVRVFVYVTRGKVTVYLDLSGQPLAQRGYRTEAGEAPLRETLAAAVLRLSGWDRVAPLVDPMCGSGTLGIEAAMWAGGMAPGLLREQFGFERWACFDETEVETMRELRGEARQGAKGSGVSITASDADGDVIEVARRNARRAGVKIAIKQRVMGDWESDGYRRMLVTNPPYDVRLGAAPEFCRAIASTIGRLHGWRVAMITGSPDYARALSRKPEVSLPIQNGSLDCRLLVYEIE